MSLATTVVRRATRLPARTPDEGRMSLVEHLRELRVRAIRALAAVVVITFLCLFVVYERLNDLIIKPYCSVPTTERTVPNSAADPCSLIFHGPADAFTYRFKVALIAGLVLSAPFWLYQLWRFVTPGLKTNERTYAIGFVATSTALFALGTAVAYLIMHTTLTALLGFGGHHVVAQLTADDYLSFVLKLLLIFGLAFEFPLLVIVLNAAGILPAAALRKWRRVALFLCVVFGGVAAPSPDPFTMLALAVPLMVLYEASVTVARLHDRRVAARVAASPYAQLGDDEVSPLETTYAGPGDPGARPPQGPDLGDAT